MLSEAQIGRHMKEIKMPTGEFKRTDIATEAERDEIIQEFLDDVMTGDPPPVITVEGEPTGPWTVIAKYP